MSHSHWFDWWERTFFDPSPIHPSFFIRLGAVNQDCFCWGRFHRFEKVDTLSIDPEVSSEKLEFARGWFFGSKRSLFFSRHDFLSLPPLSTRTRFLGCFFVESMVSCVRFLDIAGSTECVFERVFWRMPSCAFFVLLVIGPPFVSDSSPPPSQ